MIQDPAPITVSVQCASMAPTTPIGFCAGSLWVLTEEDGQSATS